MKISACIITNDNYKIEHCLHSIKKSVSEIVVTYTASDEDFYKWLNKVLSKTGIEYKLNRFKWCDDFSKARNCGIKEATGDWILIIDTDEELERPIKYLNSEFDFYLFNIVNGDNSAWSIRLFKNRIGILFKNRVHEEVEWVCSKLNGCKADVNIVHSGLTEATKEELESKWERNMKLLEMDTDNPARNMHYACLYAWKNEHIKSINYAMNALQDAFNDESKAALCNLIFENYRALGMTETGLEFLAMSLEFIPLQVKARHEIINILYNKGKKELLLKELENVASICEHRNSDLQNDVYIEPQLLKEKIKEIKKNGNWSKTPCGQ